MPTLEFKGKQFVYAHHLSVPFRPLIVDAKKSLLAKGEKPNLDGNLIIHGDNLHALKALLPTYAGKIDCIYIDPPYNTGNEGWIYNDNVNGPLIRDWIKKASPVDKEDLERHDKWLCMIWPRLTLLHELLHPEGLLFISINSCEAANLRCIIEEIFGEEAFLGEFIWKSRQNKDNRNVSGLSNDHEFIFIIGKKLAGEKRLVEAFDNPDNDPRGPWSSGNMVGLASEEDRPNLHFDLIDPKTKINYGCPPRGWRYGKETMKQLIAEKSILWPPSPAGRPREKAFLSEMPPRTNVSSVITKPIFTRNGTDAFERIFGHREFAFPKPPELIEFLLEQHPNPNAIVLDNFAGSGTTGQAVLEANRKDGGHRRFILVEMEDYADKITAERMRHVIKGVRNARDETQREGIKASFSYCTLGDEISLNGLLKGSQLPDYQSLARYVFYTATGRTLDAVAKPNAEFIIGETDIYRAHLIYKPDRDFLRSSDSALNAEMAERISKGNKDGKKSLVFATAKFMGQRELTERHIEFCQLPYAIHRVLGG
jgi:adenine-specific DNA-methyltransferase